MKTSLITAIAGFLTLSSGLLISAPAHALEVGDAAPCVVLEDVQTDGSSIEQCIRTRPPGQKYVLIEFFSITCSACEANLPILSQLSADILGQAQVREVSIDKNRDSILTFLQAKKSLINFPVALDVDRDAKKSYGVTATPTIFVLDENNTVVYKSIGVFSQKQLNAIKSIVSK